METTTDSAPVTSTPQRQDYSVTPEMIAEMEGASSQEGQQTQSFADKMKEFFADDEAKDESQPESESEEPDALKQLLSDDAEDKAAGEPKDEAQSKEASTDKFVLNHRGQRIELDKDETIQYAQKGFDYEQKMGMLKEERAEFEENIAVFKKQVAEAEKKFERELTDQREYNAYIEWLEATHPEKFQESAELFQMFKKQSGNPFFERKIQEIERKYEPLRQKIAQQENEQILGQFRSEMAQVKALHEKAFGEKFPWTKEVEKEIADTWASIEKAKKNSVKDAYRLLYEDKLNTLVNSKQALNNVKKQAAPKPATIGKVNASTAKTRPNIDVKKMDYRNIADAIYKQLI